MPFDARARAVFIVGRAWLSDPHRASCKRRSPIATRRAQAPTLRRHSHPLLRAARRRQRWPTRIDERRRHARQRRARGDRRAARQGDHARREHARRSSERRRSSCSRRIAAAHRPARPRRHHRRSRRRARARSSRHSACYLIGLGKRVAVLAVDPSSARSGGSILGDKTRMAAPVGGARGVHPAEPVGRLARRRRAADARGDAGVRGGGLRRRDRRDGRRRAIRRSRSRRWSTSSSVLMLAGAGDELQGIGKGILEIADALAINKAGRRETSHMASRPRCSIAALNLFRHAEPDVGSTGRDAERASRSRGMDTIWGIIQDHRRQAQCDAASSMPKRREQQRVVVLGTSSRRASRRAPRRPDVSRRAPRGLEGAVTAGETSPTAATRAASSAALPAP